MRHTLPGDNFVNIFFVISLSVSLHNLLDFYIYIYIYIYTVRPVHAVSSIKQSHVFKGHILLSCHRTFIYTHIEPLLRGNLSYKATLFLSER